MSASPSHSPSESHENAASRLPRRQWLAAVGLSATGLIASRSSGAQGAASAPQRLTAATPEGPFYVADAPERADITEGLHGVPLELKLTVLDVRGQPVAETVLDVWHCDATGLYSGFADQGEGHRGSAEGNTHLRGRQPTGADGVATFRTLYPGWHRGRTTHIHCKVWRGARELLTTQFFLPDALSEFLYTQLPAYRRTQARDVLNSSDGIALEAGDTVMGAIRELPDRYVASLTLVVDPATGPTGFWRRGPPSGDRPERPGRAPGRGPAGPAATEGDARVHALVPVATRERR